MKKVSLRPGTFLYPMPLVVVGSVVDGMCNYMPVSYCGIVQHKPPMISITLGRNRYTNRGIKKNQAFSVNIPSVEMINAVDFCGMYSGAHVDKSEVFDSYFGRLGNAPMIASSPLSMECELVQVVDFGGTNEIFIGEIVEVYSEKKYLTNGLPDIEKIQPVAFSMHDNRYWSLGEHIGDAWNCGHNYALQVAEYEA